MNDFGRSFKAIIFDCDGVLVDSEPVYAEAFHQALRARNLNLSADFLRHALRGQSLKDCYVWLAQHHNLVVDDTFHGDLLQATDRLLNSIQPVAGVIELLEDLVCPKAVASNGLRESVASNLERCGLSAFFGEHIYTVEQVAKPKPAPDIYALAAKGLGLPSQDCLVIEDSPLGVQAALAAGSAVCWLTEEGSDAKGFQGVAVFKVRSLLEVKIWLQGQALFGLS